VTVKVKKIEGTGQSIRALPRQTQPQFESVSGYQPHNTQQRLGHREGSLSSLAPFQWPLCATHTPTHAPLLHGKLDCRPQEHLPPEEEER